MIVTLAFPGALPAPYGAPWLAVVTCWPASGSPALRFGKRVKGGQPPACTIDASPGMIVRWGQKNTADGSTDGDGWGVVRPDGNISQLNDADAAKAAQWRVSPADAQAPPTVIPRAGKGKPYARQPRQAGTVPTGRAAPAAGIVAGLAALTVEDLARRMLVLVGDDLNDPSLVQKVIDYARALSVGVPARPAPAPAAPEAEDQASEAPRPVLPTPLGPEGYPLF